MKPIALLAGLIVMHFAGMTHAGTLNNGEWKPSQCGVKPATPIIDDQDVDGFNKSVAAINDWQQQARVYFECLIKEANADNNVIAESANREQAAYRQSVEAVGAAAEAAKKKLDKK